MSKRNVFSLVLSLSLYFVSAQHLIVSVDGKNNLSTDTITLMSQNQFTQKKGLEFPLPLYPGKVNTYSLNVSQADLYGVNSTWPVVFLGKNDSIAISFNPKDSSYTITGGRYPKNYTIYKTFEDVKPDYRYKTEKDNYIGYVKYLDSFSLGRQAVLDAEKAKGGMSEDVYAYMEAYLKYAHLEALLVTNSASLRKLLPQTGSVFAPNVSTNDFTNDAYLRMDIYPLCTNLYLNILTQRDIANTANTFRSPLSKQLYATILLAIDSLKGETRGGILYDKIMNHDWKDEAKDKDLFKPLFDRIKHLKLPQDNLILMEEQYAKAMLNGESIDTVLSANTNLVSLDGKRQSLQSLLSSYKGKKVMIDLWWTADEERELSSNKELNKFYPRNDYSTVHIAVNRRATPDKWMEICKNSGLTGAQYYLEGNFKSPLLSYFHASNLPQYISIDQAGKIENSNVPFYFMLNMDTEDNTIK